jgi:hypothetical protein
MGKARSFMVSARATADAMNSVDRNVKMYA